jgi:hypothetical protein
MINENKMKNESTSLLKQFQNLIEIVETFVKSILPTLTHIYIDNIHTLSANIKCIWMSFRNR